MKLGYMIGAGVVLVAGGMFLAWSLDDRSAQANVAPAEPTVAASTPAPAAPASGVISSRLSALSTFDQFWTRVSTDRTGLDAISIKVSIPHANGAEQLWMTGCQSADAQTFDCVVSNEATHVALKLGSRFQFVRSSISDWMYRENGKIHGGYSIRELLPSMAADQAAQMNAMLAPLPR